MRFILRNDGVFFSAERYRLRKLNRIRTYNHSGCRSTIELSIYLFITRISTGAVFSSSTQTLSLQSASAFDDGFAIPLQFNLKSNIRQLILFIAFQEYISKILSSLSYQEYHLPFHIGHIIAFYTDFPYDQDGDYRNTLYYIAPEPL